MPSDDISYFAERVSVIIKDECSITYTDFINDIGPIMSKLEEHGINSVAYYGELDPKSRYEIYIKWKTCLLYTSPSPRDATLSRMPSSA